MLTYAVPEFPLVFRHVSNMIEPGSVMEFVMSVTVNPAGQTTDVEFVQPSGLRRASEVPPLYADILSTVRRWRFAPTTNSSDGRVFPVTVRYRTMLWSSSPEELEPITEGCSVEVRDYAVRGRFETLNDIPPEYRFLYDWARGTEETRAALPYTAITLDRTGCLGTCPSYRVTLFRDGRAQYEGRAFTARKGNYSGTIIRGTYGHLCYAIDALGFLNMNARYSAPVTDQPSLTISVDSEDKHFEVSDYASQGPPELWVLGQAIDNVVNGIEWELNDESPPNHEFERSAPRRR